eukprot:2448392-Amphidinium_carterae.1
MTAEAIRPPPRIIDGHANTNPTCASACTLPLVYTVTFLCDDAEDTNYCNMVDDNRMHTAQRDGI